MFYFVEVENRGAVGETAFHVCFLMGTPVHIYCSKRMLAIFPVLLHDIYLSEEYYGENVLHMSCVAGRSTPRSKGKFIWTVRQSDKVNKSKKCSKLRLLEQILCFQNKN